MKRPKGRNEHSPTLSPFKQAKTTVKQGRKGQMFPENFQPFQLVLANKKCICKIDLFFLTKTSKFRKVLKIQVIENMLI